MSLLSLHIALKADVEGERGKQDSEEIAKRFNETRQGLKYMPENGRGEQTRNQH